MSENQASEIEGDIEQPLFRPNGQGGGRKKGFFGNNVRIYMTIGIAIGALVNAIILVLIFTSKNEVPVVLQFEDIFDADFKFAHVEVQWLSDTPGNYFVNEENDSGNIIATTLSDDGSAVVDILMNRTFLVNGTNNNEPIDYEMWFLSPSDGKFILLAIDTQQVWRHSWKANFLLWDVAGKSFRFLADPVKGKLSNVLWNPRNHMVSFVRDNNVYLVDVDQLTDGNYNEEQITFDAQWNIFNGIMGWAYEEEVFEDYQAMWWSHDGTRLAFFHTNETLVNTSHMFDYEEDDIYTQLREFPYPKPGYAIPYVELKIWIQEKDQVFTLTFNSSEYNTQDHYLNSVIWNEDGYLLVRRLERSQQVESYWKVDGNTAEIYKKLDEYSTPFGWISAFPPIMYNLEGNSEGNMVAIIRPKEDNYQIALMDWVEGGIVAWATDDLFDVNLLLGFDRRYNSLYYSAISNFSTPAPVSQSIYKLKMDESFHQELISPAEEGFFGAVFAPLGDYFLFNSMGPDIPSQYYISSEDITKKYLIENNTLLNTKLSNLSLPEQTFFGIDVPTKDNANDDDDDMVTLFGYILTPPHYQSSISYPCLFNPYGGPSSQMATSAFPRDFYQWYLASQGYVIVVVDGRGTGGRGSIFEKQVYLRLGEMAIADQLSVAKQISTKFSFIDNARIAIWGWSFGGYVSSGVMSNGSDTFALGVATSPVTDWRYYDSAYTERYMQTPVSNPMGYLDTSILPKATGISKDFMLIHGTGDDNVHFMNSALLNERLVEGNIPFRTMFYRHLKETKRLKYQRVIQNHRERLGILKLEEPLSELNEKTVDSKEFQAYIKARTKINNQLLPLYADLKFRQYRWYSYLERRRAEDNMINRVKQAFEKHVIVFYGDWSRRSQMKFFAPTPNKKIKRVFAQHFQVYDLDEYRTSKLYRKTGEEGSNLNLKDKHKKLRKKHAIKTFTMHNRMECINRDRNACLNMTKLVSHYLDTGQWLSAFSRNKSTDINPSKRGLKRRRLEASSDIMPLSGYNSCGEKSNFS